MAAYSNGSVPQQRRWLYEQLISSSKYSQDQLECVVRRLYGHQTTLDFLPASSSPIPHARRLQHGYVAVDQLGRMYHPYPEGEEDGLSADFFQTARFFVATPFDSWQVTTDRQVDLRSELPRAGDEVQLRLVSNSRTVMTQVAYVVESRDASALITLKDALIFRPNLSEFIAMATREIAAALVELV